MNEKELNEAGKRACSRVLRGRRFKIVPKDENKKRRKDEIEKEEEKKRS